jgi:hypothetical protein
MVFRRYQFQLQFLIWVAQTSFFYFKLFLKTNIISNCLKKYLALIGNMVSYKSYNSWTNDMHVRGFVMCVAMEYV